MIDELGVKGYPLLMKKPTKATDKLILPLAVLDGVKPVAPGWFAKCVETPATDASTEVSGVNIRYRVWGEAGKPGLIFVHGGVAHKGWWDFIVPFFVPHFRVVALDLSGMGESGWRETYNVELYADEVLACATAAGLFDNAQKPWVIGHSFGGFVALGFAAKFGQQIQGAVVIDSPIRPADKQERSAPKTRGGKLYGSEAAALARFRLLPSQQCENLFLIDHIARHGLKQVDGGWKWRFDPELWPKMRYDMRAAIETVSAITTPITLIRGERSALVNDEVWQFMKQAFPLSQHHVSIPGAQHHVMLDQPLALVSSLRTILGSGI